MVKNIDIIIQARITSKRFPNKILKKIGKKRILEIMYERLKFSKKFKKIIFAIPNNKKNKPLLDFLKYKKYRYFLGDEHNVLKRYYLASKKYRSRYIMRLTSDCPLIDYKICERLSKIFFKKRVDHVYTGSSFAEGLDVEILSFKCLKKIYKDAKSETEKEHATHYIKNHPNKFNSLKIEKHRDDSSIRITLDERKDFLVIQKIIRRFPKILNNIYVSSEKIIKFLKESPNIMKINSKIIRNEGLLRSLRKERQKNSHITI